MKKLIFIALLIVGCAPTKPPAAEFYIGMTEQEFIEKNDHMKTLRSDINTGYVIHTECEVCKKLGVFEYTYGFKHDTLWAVWKGSHNMVRQKEIDYDKYATPPELKEPEEPIEPEEGVMPIVPKVEIPEQPEPPQTEDE